MGFLAGKTAIITGAGYAKLSNGRCGSIGYGIATAYAKEGANLGVVANRNANALAAPLRNLRLGNSNGVSQLLLCAIRHKPLDQLFANYVFHALSP